MDTELVVAKELKFVVTIRINDAVSARTKDECGDDITYADSGKRLMDGVMNALSAMPDEGVVKDVAIEVIVDKKPVALIVQEG